MALSQILGWKNSPRVSQEQLRGSHPWLSTDSILRVIKVHRQGNVKTLKMLRETETVPHGRTGRSWPICRQNEVNTTRFWGCLTQNRPRKLCHVQHWHGRTRQPALPGAWGSLTAELRCVKGFTDVKPHLDNAWNKSLTFFTQLCTNRLGSSRVETAAPRDFHVSGPINCLKPSPLASKVELARRRQDSPC